MVRTSLALQSAIDKTNRRRLPVAHPAMDPESFFSGDNGRYAYWCYRCVTIDPKISTWAV